MSKHIQSDLQTCSDKGVHEASVAYIEVNAALDASAAAKAEKAMTLWQGLKLYPKAVAWSAAISMCLIMEGFDLVLISGLYGQPAFARRFGELQMDGSYQLSAPWQAGLNNSALCGEILGLMFVGLIADRIGYRKTLVLALVLLTGFIFILFFAQNLPMLAAGEVLCGIAWGAFQTLTTSYAVEVCPIVLRAYLTTYVNLCWVMGQFIASGVLKSMADKWGSLAYRLPFALQWVWPAPLILIMALAPESPWWLVRKSREAEAKRSLLRLTTRSDPNFDVNQTVSMMVYTTAIEREKEAASSYSACFRGTNLRRTEICCMVWAIQILCGGYMMGFSTYFYEQAGLDPSNAFSMTLIQTAMGFVGTILSWFLINWFGRRTLYVWGQVGMIVCLMLGALLGLASKNHPSLNWGVGSTLMIYTLVYDASIGPVCYSLVAELSSTLLRNKTIVLARNVYNVSGIVANVLITRQLNPSAWNWGTSTGFFWSGSCLLCLIWTYFRLPEPKGRSFAELDILFENNVPARKFATTTVDTFDTSAWRGSYHKADKPKQSTVHFERQVECM
ncbi:General alpha-glucoside permease [Cercospora beticola]|uniref:General alpha-glucoside permease n=1 Tax=Cercospora beticola TaxID=122368 RepID=A0A2G5GSE9_CERBT|nr:General alpha-glucoside permease [Cercospora beticola]PIA82923.1 General alpha-glucoside permease [Cercospora beticola]WPB04943.1 hypothetical protein RHO25_009591 [Cercospora beticola]